MYFDQYSNFRRNKISGAHAGIIRVGIPPYSGYPAVGVKYRSHGPDARRDSTRLNLAGPAFQPYSVRVSERDRRVILPVEFKVRLGKVVSRCVMISGLQKLLEPISKRQ